MKCRCFIAIYKDGYHVTSDLNNALVKYTLLLLSNLANVAVAEAILTQEFAVLQLSVDEVASRYLKPLIILIVTPFMVKYPTLWFVRLTMTLRFSILFAMPYAKLTS